MVFGEAASDLQGPAHVGVEGRQNGRADVGRQSDAGDRGSRATARRDVGVGGEARLLTPAVFVHRLGVRAAHAGIGLGVMGLHRADAVEEDRACHLFAVGQVLALRGEADAGRAFVVAILTGVRHAQEPGLVEGHLRLRGDDAGDLDLGIHQLGYCHGQNRRGSEEKPKDCDGDTRHHHMDLLTRRHTRVSFLQAQGLRLGLSRLPHIHIRFTS